MKLLIADSEPEALQVADFLRQSGFEVDVEPNTCQTVRSSRFTAYDLVLINTASRGGEGFKILRQVKSRASLPVMMVTEREDWQGRVQALNLGAEDCLSKPYRPEELLARICAVLRRTNPVIEEAPEILAGELRFCGADRKVYIHDMAVEFTAIECEILELLMKHCGRVVSRDWISLRLYNRPASPFDRAVDTHISRIRRKLGETGRLIVSARGTGYQLCIHDPLKAAAASGRAPGLERSFLREMRAQAGYGGRPKT